MQRNVPGILWFLLLIFLLACKPDINKEKLKQELIDLHNNQIKAHWDKDITFFTKDLASDYWQVARGEISFPEVNEIRDRFTSYLNSTSFTKYENIEEPMVRISDDGSMAWIIVKVKIEGESIVSDTSDRLLDFTCAWITLYNREDGKWIRQGEVSTFR